MSHKSQLLSDFESSEVDLKALRADSQIPLFLQELVVGVHQRAAECKDQMSQRTEVMLELILDIKNNRQPKGSAKGAVLEMYLGQGAQRWLKESRVPEIQLRAATWEVLLSPEKKVACCSCLIF